jgi:hypothetical protein
VKKRTAKKLTLNKESILRLNSSSLREAIGGVSLNCSGTDLCSESCAPTCGPRTCYNC